MTHLPGSAGQETARLSGERATFVKEMPTTKRYEWRRAMGGRDAVGGRPGGRPLCTLEYNAPRNMMQEIQ